MVFNIGNTLILLHRAQAIVRNDIFLNGEYSSYIAYRLSLIMRLSDELCVKALVCGLLQHYSSNHIDNDSHETNSESLAKRIILGECSVFKDFATPTRYKDCDFKSLIKYNLTEDELIISSILKISNCFCEYLQRTYKLEDSNFERMDAIHQIDFDKFKLIVKRHDFYPGLVLSLERLVQLDDFWFYFREDYIEGMIRTMNFNNVLPVMNDDHTLNLARLLSTIVDMKSPLTYQHSIKVGEIANFIGKKMHLDRKTCNRLRLAGLLHDIGKINVNDCILNKNGKLSTDEYRRIQVHATDTRGILRSIIIDPDVVAWAAEHHERLDGSGYPMKKKDEQLTLQSRILAIADVFQALCQKRSYRDGLHIHDVINIIRSECVQNKLCGKTFSVFEKYAEQCYEIAK